MLNVRIISVFMLIQKKTSQFIRIRTLILKPGDDLLSHGETPHYHRRYIVSLLSSGWDQVVPKLYGRQENSYESKPILFQVKSQIKCRNVKATSDSKHKLLIQSFLLYGQASRVISTG